MINELLAHAIRPSSFIELFNRGTQGVDLWGCVITDDPALPRYRLPANTILAAGGFLTLDQGQLGFALNAAGEAVFLVNSNATRVLDAIQFGPQENGVSLGRHGDGADAFRRLAEPTPGSANAGRRPNPVVINEVMFNPLSGEDADEYVELHNAGPAPVPLGGWRFTDGIDFEFPSAAWLPA